MFAWILVACASPDTTAGSDAVPRGDAEVEPRVEKRDGTESPPEQGNPSSPRASAGSPSSGLQRRVDPEAPDTVAEALPSHDLNSVASQIARDLMAAEVLAPATEGGRVSISFLELRNETSSAVDKERITTTLCARLAAGLGDRVEIRDRTDSSLAELRRELAAQQQRPGTEKDQPTARLVLRGAMRERVRQVGKARSVQHVTRFDLLDLSTETPVWASEYVTEFPSDGPSLGR